MDRLRVRAMVLILSGFAGLSAFAHAPHQTSVAIRGTVVDGSTQLPIAEAAINSGHADVMWSAAKPSGTDGTFVFEGFSEGGWPLSASKPGYCLGEGSTAWVTVTGGKAPSSVRLTLFRCPHVSGRVTDRAGHPIRAAIEVISSESLNGRLRFDVNPGDFYETDDNGRFSVDLSSRKPVVVAVFELGNGSGTGFHQSQIIVPTYFPGVVNVESATLTDLSWGDSADLGDCAVDLAPLAVLLGHVHGLRPQESASVRLKSLTLGSGNHDEWAEVDASGAFKARLAPGPYLARLEMTGRSETGRTQADRNSTGAYLEQRISLNPGEQKVDLDVRRGPSVAGSVWYLGPMPTELNTIHLWLVPYEFDGDRREASPDEHGHFQFDGVVPGRYFVRAQVPEPWRLADAELGGRTVADQPLTVSQEGVRGLEVTLDPSTSSLSGAILKENLSATPTLVAFSAERSLWVDFPEPFFGEDVDRRFAFAEIEKDGRYRFPRLPKGLYYLIAYVGDDRYAFSPEMLEALAAHATLVQVGGATTAPPLKVVHFTGRIPS